MIEQQEQTQKDEAEIRAVIERLHQAHHDKDVHAIAASFAQDAAIFNLAPPLRHTGINLKEKQAWLDSWDGPIEITAKRFEHYDQRRHCVLPLLLADDWRSEVRPAAGRFLDARKLYA